MPPPSNGRPLAVPRPFGQRLYDWLHGSPTGLLALAIGVGAGAGVGAVAFRYLILWFTILFSGHEDYSAAGHAAHPLLPLLGAWFVVLAPIVGGLLYGPLVDWFAREARGHGVPEVMLAVAEQGGRIRPQVAVVKSFASALCIGAGGSVGREGPIVQIGSALGSGLGQLLRVPESRLRLLVACGAAGGISATFNAPIAGVVFALELILRDFEAESFGVVVPASVVANVIGRAAFGSSAFLTLPPFQLTSLTEYGFYAVLGVLAAFAGVGFIRSLYGLEDLADRLWRGPEWLRPAAGGIVLGLLLLALPQMYGVGYPVLEGAIRGSYAVPFLLLLLAGKVVATSLTIAIGGSGGVFAPSLFIGAMLGSAFGDAIQRLPGLHGSAGAYGLVGMGAVFAGAARAPLTAVIIIFELTGDYQIILPLMFAIALATGGSRLLSADTIYTLKLRRRGIDITRGRTVDAMEALRVRDAMGSVPAAIPIDTALSGIVAKLAGSDLESLPVIDADGRYRGVISTRQLERALADTRHDAVAGDLAEQPPTASLDQSLTEALPLLLHGETSGLPVLGPDAGTVVGWLTHRDVLRAYQARQRLSARQDGVGLARRAAVGPRWSAPGRTTE
ncbi:MAG TPA: chloride channel protein [Methylomirabilota bacterium]|jgi:CIC family chloride channel protein